MGDQPVSVEKLLRLMYLGLHGLEGHDGEITTKGGYRAHIVELDDDGGHSGPRRIVLAFEHIRAAASVEHAASD
jgi:hypothetical protein